MRRHATAAAALLLPAPDANAAILAQYSFDGNSLDSSDSDARTNATILGEGPFVISDFDARGNPNPSRFVSFPAIFPQSRQDALDFDYYFNFQVAANAGNQFSLSNLEFQTDVGPSDMGDNGSFFVQADTGSAGTFSDISPTFTQASTDAANFLPRTSFDLGGTGFFTRPVEFRIYVFSNGGFRRRRPAPGQHHAQRRLAGRRRPGARTLHRNLDAARRRHATGAVAPQARPTLWRIGARLSVPAVQVSDGHKKSARLNRAARFFAFGRALLFVMR